jgi:hypothetical protein
METMLGNTLETWGKYWEPDENQLGTSSEHIGNKGKMKKNKKKIPFPPLPPKT